MYLVKCTAQNRQTPALMGHACHGERWTLSKITHQILIKTDDIMVLCVYLAGLRHSHVVDKLLFSVYL